MNVQKLTCGPVVKGVEEDYGKNFIRLWGRAHNDHLLGHTFLVTRIKKVIEEDYSDPIILEVFRKNDFTGLISIDNLEEDTNYEYMMGYVNFKTVKSGMIELNWENANTGKFKTDSTNLEQSNNLTFVFGSCRRYSKVGPLVLFGTGESADIIYGSILAHPIDFFMSIGDQVYHDPLGNIIGRARSLRRMRKRYRTVRNYPQIKSLMANTTTYEICDDHDCHCNNTNWQKRKDEPRIFKNGIRSYKEYQHLFGTIESDKLWYTFDRENGTFFVFDTRSKRDERVIDDEGTKKIKEIIDHRQMEAFKSWITNPENENRTKFVVSSCPLVSQKTADSWYGFPEQQKTVLELVARIPKTFILTGDAHCCRTGTYMLDDDEDKLVTEILSSGLVAVNHDIGKKYTEGDDILGYDVNNDFPFVIDNSYSNGVKITTIYSSKSYPYPNKPTTIHDKIRGLKHRVIDNVFTKIILDDDTLTIEVYNQHNTLLDTIKFQN